MSDLRIFAQQQSVSRASDGTWVALRGTRDGSVSVIPWVMSLVLEGRVFNAEGGATDSSPLTLATSYADTTKTLFVDIPDGTAGIPLFAEVGSEASGAAGVETIIGTSGVLNGTGGTETAITVINLRADNPVTSGATAAHTASSETDTVTGAQGEVALRKQFVNQDLDGVAIDPNVTWSFKEADVTPIIVDAGSFNVTRISATSGTGHAIATWAEVTESAFT